MLTVLPGLEEIAADEAERKTHAVIDTSIRGKIFLTASPFDFNVLRCVDNVYELLNTGEMGTTRAALKTLRDGLVKGFTPPDKTQRFIVNAAVAGRHNYSRFEAAEACGEAMVVLGLIPGVRENRDTEFRLDIMDGFYIFSKKLTGAAFRFRGTSRLFTKAALRPTVAAALVWVSKPAEGDVFLDTFCGSGSILNERAFYPFRRITGVDINEDTLSAAKYNIKAGGLKDTYIELVCSDALTFNYPMSSADVICTNPPWGGQIKTDDMEGLYKGFLNRCRDWLKPAGRIIIITPLADTLCKAAGVTGFTLRKITAVSLHGTVSYIYEGCAL
jgi:23S rRNA G2445 N2-methylase RlmL